MGRIIDMIESRRRKAPNPSSKPLYYSFEFFPPKTEAGLDNLLMRMDRMIGRLDPLFIDVTWGASGSTAARSMAVATHAQKFSGVQVLLHLTCAGMNRDQLLRTLEQSKANGIRNLLILRGDPPRSIQSWKPNDVSGGHCDRSIDLVRLVREVYGTYFCIAVAGHPEGHPSSISRKEEMKHLKEKITAGADFIITQFFYDCHSFFDFVLACREEGITCPILPGIMPIHSYSSFVRMTKYCNISVPKSLMNRLESVKDNDDAIKEIGIDLAVDMCQQLLQRPVEEGGVDGIHFYTLNLERSVTQILLGMQVIDVVVDRATKDSTVGRRRGFSISDVKPIPSSRALPWRPSALDERSKEEVRPINWANRPKSYVMRTETWDEFPNGRWGDSTSPAFGELSEVSHFYNFTIPQDDRRAMLGHEPKTVQDVYNVFAKYIEGKIASIPWCETPLEPESFLIQPQLVELNLAGFLTINSQPSVNGVPSTHPIFGWGGPGGYVYQKAYVECFVSPENAERLLQELDAHPSMVMYGVNALGEELRAGSIQEGLTTALTWGVFPNREIVQPTIFDPLTFSVWAEEAFSLWSVMWLDLYEPDSDSYDLIQTIRDAYFLIAIIDNNFVSDNSSQIFSAMYQLFHNK